MLAILVLCLVLLDHSLSFHLDNHATTDFKPEIEFKMMNEMYVALCMRTHIQKRQHFHHRRLMQNFTRNDLHIVEAHTALDIFSFAVFFFIWGSSLRLSLSLIFLAEFIINMPSRQLINRSYLERKFLSPSSNIFMKIASQC